MAYRGWRVAVWVARHVPAGLAYRVARWAGTAAWWLWPRGRRATRANFRRVLRGQARREIDRTARRSLANYCAYVVDFARLQGLGPGDAAATIANPEILERLAHYRDEGRSVLIVAFHFGLWDLGAAGAAARGYRMTVVADTFGDERLDRDVMGVRERMGMRVVKADRIGPSLFRELSEARIVAVVADRPLESGGVVVDLFGEAVRLPDGPARLALRTGAKVVPAAFVRTGPGSADARILADWSVEVRPGGSRAERLGGLMQDVVAAHERFIAAHPDQWYMFRQMWKEGG